MVGLEENIFESVGVFNTLNSSKNDNENYIKFALNKTSHLLMEIENIITEAKLFSVEEAKLQLSILATLKPQIPQIKKNILTSKNVDQELKQACINYLKAFDELVYELEEIVVDHNLVLMMEISRNDPNREISTESNEDFRNRLKARIDELNSH